MQKFLVFQSLWAMERRHTDGMERSLEQNLEMIQQAGFDGLSYSLGTQPRPSGSQNFVPQQACKWNGSASPKR